MCSGVPVAGEVGGEVAKVSMAPLRGGSAPSSDKLSANGVEGDDGRIEVCASIPPTITTSTYTTSRIAESSPAEPPARGSV